MGRGLRSAWQNLDTGWKLAIWLAVTLRAGLELVGMVSINLQPLTFTGPDLQSLVIQGGKPWSQLLSLWQRWDALWYQDIAQSGYHAGTNLADFWPLYPLLSRTISVFLFGQIVPAELLVSSMAFLVAMSLLYRLARMDVGPVAARLAVLLTAFFPVGFFLLAPYTESLFLALTLAAFLFARQGRPWLAGWAGFFAALTRNFGAFLVLPLAFEYLRQHDTGERGGIRELFRGPGVLSATLAPLGMIVLNVYQHVVVGEQRSLLAVQATGGYRVVPPWESLHESWNYMSARGDPIEILNFLCLILFSVLALLALWKLPLVYSLYVGPYLGLIFLRTMGYQPLMSVSRFTLMLFPCFIVLALWLSTRPRVAAGCLVFGLLMQALLFQYWVHAGFVG